MNAKKCIDCFNDNIKQYIEISPCMHILCYNCISLRLITKPIHYYLDKNTNEFIIKCTKWPDDSNRRLSYEQIDSILSTTTKSESSTKEIYCSMHKSKYDYYCHSCKSNICKECISDDHKYHQWMMIKEYKQNLRLVSANWIHKSYKDLELSLKKNSEIVINSLQDNYDLLNTRITNAISELKAYSTQIANEKEKKLKEMKCFIKIIKRINKKYYNDIEEIESKDINEVKYLLKVKYAYVKMSFEPFYHLQVNDNKKSNDDIVYLPKLKPPCIHYTFVKQKKVAITFTSKIRKVQECLNIINTKNTVGNMLFLNENEIYFSSGSLGSDSKDKNIQIYNIKQRKFDLIQTHHSYSVICLCQINSNKIASGSYDNTIKLWNLSTHQEEGTLLGHKGAINTLQLWKMDFLVSGSQDFSIKIWNLINMTCVNSYSSNGHNEGVYSLYIVDSIIYSGGQQRDIKILNIINKNNANKQSFSINQIGLLKGHSNYVFVIRGNQGKVKQIASGSKDSTIRIWKKSTGKCIGILTGHSSYITDLSYLLDNRLASSSKDKTIRIWNMNSMNCDFVLQAQEGPILALALLHDGRLLSGFKDHMIRIWG